MNRASIPPKLGMCTPSYHVRFSAKNLNSPAWPLVQYKSKGCRAVTRIADCFRGSLGIGIPVQGLRISWHLICFFQLPHELEGDHVKNITHRLGLLLVFFTRETKPPSDQ